MVKEVKFTVAGEPQGKGRPRFAARYNPQTGKSFGKVYTPDKTAVYENLIRMEYERQCGEIKFPDDAMLDMRIRAYYSIPKSVSKKKKALMLDGRLRPVKKPDQDNVIKVFADSLNKLAYKDDTQIVDCQCRKFYSENPRVDVIIRLIEKEGI